jgi:hypothetical protein
VLQPAASAREALAVTMKRTGIAIALAALGAVASGVPSEPLATGEYATENGTGTLVISSGTSGEETLTLTAEGANGHSVALYLGLGVVALCVAWLRDP